MAMNIFQVGLSDIADTSVLALSTRIRNYQSSNESKNLLQFSYFLEPQNKFSIGKIKREEYKETGEFPIIDQSKDFIVGYSDEESVYNGKLPVIVFGDHTRIFKYVDFPFIQGADGIQIITPDEKKVNPKFFYYMLKHFGVPSRDYNRHFTLLKQQRYPLIERSVQDETIRCIEPLERQIKNMQESIADPTEPVNRVFEQEFDLHLKEIKYALDNRLLLTSVPQFTVHSSLRCDFKFHQHMPLFNKLISSIGDSVSLDGITTGTPVYGANEAGIDGVANVDIRYIRITDIDSLGNLLNEEWKTAQNIETQYLLQEGDFLIARSGNTVGKTFLYNSELHPKAIFAGYFIKFKLNQSPVLPIFLLYYTKSFIYETWVKGIARVKGQPNINADEYLELKIPLLPIPRQEKIVAEIQSELANREEVERQIEVKLAEIDYLVEVALSEVNSETESNH